MRPPLRSLRWIESLLEAMTAAGFSGEDAATVYRTFSSAPLGLLLGVAGGSQPGEQTTGTADPDLSTFPVLRRFGPASEP
ncbi:hypothetical protein [Actinoplanes sp. TFC3]|uniref:hypothetical protein n=1 Tax=Actinoplanes sp. TFC3 TaxID=1710355 RepID=UPI000829ACBD|nr:hypothetical protein [Actinoplanes sp. TFC3]